LYVTGVQTCALPIFGFVFMVAKDEANLRMHEQLALDGYRAAGREKDAIRASQAFVLALFLAGNYAAAREQQEEAIAGFRERNSPTEIADSSTLMAAILFRLDDRAGAWQRVTDARRFVAAAEL